MPTSAAHLQKNFKLTLREGLPQAVVETVGEAHWLMCCPLCGCMHQVLGVDETVPYTPLCQSMPVLFKTQLVTWHKLYPAVTQYTKLSLLRKVD